MSCLYRERKLNTKRRRRRRRKLFYAYNRIQYKKLKRMQQRRHDERNIDLYLQQAFISPSRRPII